MGLGGISIWQLLIVLAIVIMIFGTKRLKNIGSDLGGAIKGFKQSISEDETKEIESSTDEKNVAKAESASSDTTVNSEQPKS